MLLQALLKATIALEHQVAVFFKARPGGFNTFLRFFGAWLVLFGSKFVILEALVLRVRRHRAFRRRAGTESSR